MIVLVKDAKSILSEAYEVGLLSEAYKVGLLSEAYEVGF